jgi:phosphate transport system substrate-binding protein
MNREKKNILNKTLVVFTLIALAATVLSGCTETNENDDTGLSIVAVGRDSASGTREFFYENVMDKEDFTDNMLEKNSNGAVHQTISQTKGAIGYVGLGYVDNNIKALKVNGIEPTVANVMSGTYPIARNLNMMTAGEPTGIALEFLNFIDSDEGQAIVGEEGFVPKESSGPYTTVEGLSGSITIIGSTTVLPIASLAGEAFKALYPEVTIAVSGGGSSVGVTSAGEGTADIGMASREVKSSETEKYPTLVVHVVCSDGIAMIVHPDNDYVDGLTIQQVKDIYLGTYTNWNEL